MRTTHRRLSIALATLALPLLLADCREPTQITLELQTDAKCVDVLGTTVTVGALGELENRPEVASTERCDDGSGRIGTLVVVPSGDNDEEVAVRVVTGVGKSAQACVASGYTGGCIVARRAIRYLPHTPLKMPIFMGIDCLDVPCGETETCFKGQCVPAVIDPYQCENGNCQPLLPDGGVDGGSDAAPDQSSGGSAGASGAGGSGGTGGVATDAGDGSVLQCPEATGDCDGNPATGCETNLSSTSQHCGACGHDCLGGMCTESQCEPVVVWNGPTPTRLALDDTNVYFVDYNGGGVFRVPKTGGTATTLATGQKSVRIAVDDTHVYWTNEQGSQISRVPKQGGATQVVTNQANTPFTFTLSDSTVYYAELRAGGSVGSVAKTGGAAPTPLATGENWPFEVALTGTHLYWTELANNAGVRRVALAGGPAETVITGLNNPTAVVQDGINLYIAVFGTGGSKGQVLSLSLQGSTLTPLAINQAQPRGLAFDATFIYWTNGGDGTVMKTAKNGSGTPTVIASGGIEPLGIAVDSLAVYWADDKLNRIQRVAK